MPKRTGSNKLKKARSGGPRRARQGSHDLASVVPKSSGAGSERHDPRDDETRPERRLRDDERTSSPPAAAQASGAQSRLSIMERFQALPDTTRYGVMFAVAVAVAIVLYFAFSGGSTPSMTRSVTPAPSSSQPAAPIKIDWPSQAGSATAPARSVPATVPSAAPAPSGMAAPSGAPAAAALSPAPDTAKAKVPAAAQPTAEQAPPAARPPVPRPPGPAPKGPAPAAPGPGSGADNPY